MVSTTSTSSAMFAAFVGVASASSFGNVVGIGGKMLVGVGFVSASSGFPFLVVSSSGFPFSVMTSSAAVVGGASSFFLGFVLGCGSGGVGFVGFIGFCLGRLCRRSGCGCCWRWWSSCGLWWFTRCMSGRWGKC